MTTAFLDAYGQFLHLAETLHFSRSAEALAMSPSALTRCIQRLEEDLGQRLFVRDRRKVTLTRAGQLFREHARQQVAAHHALLEALAAEEQSPSGELRIACTVTACHSVLPDLLASCRARYPDIALQLRTGDAARSLQQLHGDEVDMAVVPAPDVADSDLRYVNPSWLVFFIESWADTNGILSAVALYVWFKSGKTNPLPIYYFMFAAPLHSYPTVLYYVSELANGLPNVDTANPINLYVKFGLSNSFWVVVPFFVFAWGAQTLERIYRARGPLPADAS